MSPVYNLSTFGRMIVVGGDELTTIRVVFVALTFVVGSTALVNACNVYARWMASRKRSASTTNSLQPLVKATFLFYVLNLIVHSLHYMDNIYRPIAYCEPKWLYDKYLLSTMEITFFANFPITYVGVRALRRIFDFTSKGLTIDRRSCIYMLFNVLGSLLTLGHYRSEPPCSYLPEVNFTIAGEGVLALCLGATVFLCLRRSGQDGKENEYVTLAQIDEPNEGDKKPHEFNAMHAGSRVIKRPRKIC
ncbi:hypothetical protein AAVH_39041 [Aphelenchoides avenae]|nr:hypothetical protein AAVH_39041 [Aphelenchus avenae]